MDENLKVRQESVFICLNQYFGPIIVFDSENVLTLLGLTDVLTRLLIFICLNLASPLLVVAYALAGTVDINFETEPLGKTENGNDVFLRDLWPSREEIQSIQRKFVIPTMYKDVYENIELGSQIWQSLKVTSEKLFPWDKKSTYVKCPPFFDEMTRDLPEIKPIRSARVLLYLGDSITTDHISPGTSIAKTSPAGRYLADHGVLSSHFGSYSSRRGNDAVMVRGTD